MSNESKSIGARYGHIKRRLRRNEPLTGELLDLALNVVGGGNSAAPLVKSMADKLKAGQELSGYELHLMIDVFFASKAGQLDINATTEYLSIKKGSGLAFNSSPEPLI